MQNCKFICKLHGNRVFTFEDISIFYIKIAKFLHRKFYNYIYFHESDE